MHPASGICRSVFMVLSVACAAHSIAAQNLVPNGDLEQYSGCPTALEQLDSALYWFNPSDTGTTLPGTPDYLNQCAAGTTAGVPATFIGYQPAHSGGGYAGLALYHQTIADYREYMEVMLTAPLTAGLCYRLDLFVNLGNGSRYSTSAIQAVLSDTLVDGVGNYHPLPLGGVMTLSSAGLFDTLAWQGVSLTFTAAGSERYLILGNFAADSLTPVTLVNPGGFGTFVYCFIDDVSLSPCVGLAPDPGTAGPTLYPNPATDRIRIRWPDGGDVAVWLTDAAGCIAAKVAPGPGGWIDLAGMSPGLYEVRIQGRTGTFSKRLIITPQ